MWLGKYFQMSREEEKWVTDQLIQLYDSALSNNELKHYNKHGLNFRYALVDTQSLSKSEPGIDSITKWIHHYLYGFNIKRNPNEDFSLSFVCSNLVPQKFQDLAAVHEYGDVIHQHDGDIHEIHRKSIRLEFEIAEKEGLYVEYVRWIKKNWPSRIKELSEFGIKI